MNMRDGGGKRYEEEGTSSWAFRMKEGKGQDLQEEGIPWSAVG